MNNARNNLPKVIGIIQIVYALLLILYGFFGLLNVLLQAAEGEIRNSTLAVSVAYMSILLCVGITLIVPAIMLVVRMFKKNGTIGKNKTRIFIASIVLSGAVILSNIAALLYARELSFLLFSLMFVLPSVAIIILTSISLRLKHAEDYLETT